MPDSARTKTGDIIAGKYVLDRALGKGATGTVWRARQLGLERQVAIKILHPQIASREEAQIRFSREARVAASLDHPSTVAVLDFGHDAGTLYLVMELIEGESLRARLNRGPLSLGDAATIARNVATALAAAHKIRLVHRDIKPENVILPNDRQAAKVVDFGLAFIADPDEVREMGRVTMDGSVAGTPAYMSPEQVRGASIGPSSDIYSLGCVLYELLANRPPFSGAVAEVFTRHAYAPPIPLRQLELADSLPPALDELVLSMLSKSPSSRPSASRVSAALAPYENPDEKRAGRTSAPMIERALRAVPASDPAQQDTVEPASIQIGVLGEIPDSLELAFAASGIHVTKWSTDEVGAQLIVWAAEQPLERLAALVASGKSVVTDVAPGDAAALPVLIRTGVADAVVRPHDADDLIRRILRVHRLAVPR